MGGGVLTYLTQLCNNLNNKYEIIILYGVRNQTPDNLNALFSKNITLVRSKYLKRSISLKNDIRACIELQKNINKYMPDIVHLNSSKAGAVGRLVKICNFSSLKNVSFIYTPHGYSFQMKDTSIVKRILFLFIEIFLGKLNTKTVACGEGEYKSSRKISSNSYYINNCVDYNNTASPYVTFHKNIVFYTVGRITDQKNPKLFNDIALNNKDIKFVWIGDGPQRHLLNSNNVHVTGWVNHNHMINMINEFDFFILCSKWEGLSISLLEAMANGKVCFASNIIGCKEVIQDNINGFLFNDLEDFQYKIDNLDKKDLRKISEQSVGTIRKKYSLSNFIDQYDSLYTSLINQNGRY